MKKMKTLAILLCLAITSTLIYGCQNDKPKSTQSSNVSSLSSVLVSSQEAEREYFIQQTFESKALQESVVPQEANQNVYIYLPPSYYDSDISYPVVYFLHGYDESPKSYLQMSTSEFDTEFKNGAKEFIFITVNGNNNLGGSFYANSPISGNWEDYVVDEVVPFIDDNFRTISDSNSRGICGFSMGGYGAYSIALKYPDIFNSLLTMSPGLIADGDFESAFNSWSGDNNFKTAYAQAFSPNKDIADIFGNIPELNGTKEDKAIITDWESGYGNINKKVNDYIALNKPLKAIKILYGTSDSYQWIPNGCEFLSKSLTERKIDHTVDALPYGHNIHPQAIDQFIVPFFNENLSYEKAN